MDPRFSRRLDWSRTENALAVAERALRDAGERFLDLTESNPTRVGLTTPEQREALAEALRCGASAPYAPNPRGALEARQAVAADYIAAGHLTITEAGQAALALDPIVARATLADRLLLTASSSESYSFLWKLLCDPGDVVLIPEPSYPLFDYLARLDGVVTRPYQLVHDGTRTSNWHLDLDSVDEALARAPGRVAALVVVSPNNPTGTVLNLDDLAALDRRATTAGFALVADEVFADYVDRPLSSQVRFLAGRATGALTFSLGGLSKSCGLPQLKLGWLAVGGPRSTAQAALDRLELISDTYLSVGTPVQTALPELLRLGAARRRSLATRIAENRRCLGELLDAGSPLSVLRSEGGWSAIVRLPAVKSDEEWALTFLNQDGVLTHPGFYFDLHEATYVVLSLILPAEIFREGVRRIVARVALSLG